MSNSQDQYARHEFSSPRNCPTGYLDRDSNGDLYCKMRGVVTVVSNGVEQSRTWWSDSDVTPADGEGPLQAPTDGFEVSR